MDIMKEPVNMNNFYLETTLDKETIRNLAAFGAIYKRYLTSAGKDAVYADDLGGYVSETIALALNEDLPPLYIGEVLGKMVKERTNAILIATHGIRTEDLTNCQQHHESNAGVQKVIGNIREYFGDYAAHMAKLPPKHISIYQQYNIYCYTEGYIKKHSIENKLGYLNLDNINKEVADIYNYVFRPDTPKTVADKLGEYYLSINDANPQIFLDPSNELFIVSMVLNYSYSAARKAFIDYFSYSPLAYSLTDKEKWDSLSKKYLSFFALLKDGILNY